MSRNYSAALVGAVSGKLRSAWAPTVLSGLLAIGLATGQGQAATQYWRTDGTSATWTGANWGTSGSGPFTTAYTANNDANFTANSTVTFATVAIGNVTVAANQTVTVTQAGTATFGATGAGGLVRTFDIGSGATLTWQSQTITGTSTAGLIKNSGGTLDVGSLTWSTSMNGGFTLNAGTLITVGNKSQGNGVLNLNGGTLSTSGTRSYTPTSIVIGGDFALAGTGNQNWDAATTIALGAATRTISNNTTSGSRQFRGLISGTSGSGLIFAGTGGAQIYIGNTGNTFDGPISITGGEVVFNDNGSFGATTSITLDGGRLTIGTMDTSGSVTALTTATIAAGKNLFVSGAAGTSISIQGATGVTTYNGVIADKPSTTGTWAKQGGGKLILGGVSTYSGNTYINNGTLQLSVGANRLPTGTTLYLGQTDSANVGIVDLNGQNQQLAGLMNSTNNLNTATVTNAIVNTGSAATLTLGGSGSYTLGDSTPTNSGAIFGPINLIKTGSGTQTLGDTNTYTGFTAINQGTLGLIKSGKLSGTTNLFLVGGATFDVSAAYDAIALLSAQTLTASGTTSSGVVATASSKGLTLGATSPLVFTAFNGSVAPLAVSGAGSITLAAGNPVTVTVANGGSPLAIGDYKLISSGTGNNTAVAGTAPTAVTVNGDGVGTATPSLVITGGELYLHVVSSTTAPSVTTQSASGFSTTGATLNGTVTADGGASLMDRGFYWATHATVTLADTQLSEGGTSVAAFSQGLSGLSANTLYYFRAYAQNSVGTTLDSADVSFYTLANTPTAPTVNNPTLNTLDVAIGSGDGNPGTTVYAIQDVGSGNYVQASGALGGSAVYQTAAAWSTKTVTGLASSTLYTFQVKAQNGAGTDTSFGAMAGDTTSTPVSPTIVADASVADFGSVVVNNLSATNQYTLSGSTLSPAAGNLTVSPPAGFEVSLDESTWVANPSALNVPYTGSTLNSTTIYVRFRPTATGVASGNIVNDGGTATPVNTSVSGTGVNSSLSDIIADGGFTTPANIDYASHQETDLTAGSPAVAQFIVRDGAGADTDSAGTTLTNIAFTVANSANLRRVALYDGATELDEEPAGATVTFTNLSATAADDSTKTLTVRASFLATVTDGQQIQFSVANAGADPAGSTFAGSGGGAASSISGTDGRIQVTASKLVFSAAASSGTVGVNFSATVQAQDANNNLDTDDTTSVTITKLTGAGTLTGGTAQSLVAGAKTFAALQNDTADTITIQAAGGSLTAATSGSIVIAGVPAQYFAGDGSALTASKWGSSAVGPFTSAFTSGNIATFSVVNGTGAGAGSITVGGLTATENFTYSAPSSTLGTGGHVVPVSVASGKTLDMSTLGVSTAAGTGLNMQGPGVFATAGGTYTGGFTLGGGTIIARGVNAMGGGGANTLTLNGGIVAGNATRDLSGKYPGGITIGGDVQFGDVVGLASTSGNLTFSDGVSLGSAHRTLTLGNTGTVAFGGIIANTGSGGITFASTAGGTGRFDITGSANTFTGPITLTGPEVRFTAAGSFGDANNTIVVDGGRLSTLSGASYAIATTHSIQVSATAGTSISTPGAGVLTYNGAIVDKPSTPGTWAKQGGGTLALGGVSTYSGDTYINNGILKLTTADNRLPTGTTLYLGQSASANVGTVDLNGLNQQVAGLMNSTNGINAATVTNAIISTGGAATLTLSGSGSYTFGDGTPTNSGAIFGAINLVKSGSGTQTLGDTNTYTGYTAIKQGVLGLIKSGKLSGTTNIFLAGGATFDVSAVANAISLLSAQTLTASGSTSSGVVATAASKGLALGATSPLKFAAFNGSVAPLAVSGAGSITLAAGEQVTVTVANGGSPLAAGTYKLISSGTGNSTAVAGTAPTSVTVNGDGMIGTPSLSIVGGELFLNGACGTITFSTSDPLPDGMVSSAYSQTIVATGGTGPYTYAVTSGSLPASLSLSSGGTISGTPTATESATFDVTATDSYGCTGVQTYHLTIQPAAAPSVSITGPALSFGNVEAGSVSAEMTNTVSGAALTDDITVSVAAGFEVSTTSGAGFGAGPIVLTQSAGTVAPTSIYVRFHPATATGYSGNLSAASTGATTQNSAVTGTGVNSAQSDIIADGGFTTPANIAYGSHQETDLTAGSLAVAQFVVRDGGAGTDSDSVGTTLTNLAITVANSANLRRVALYDGATELDEQPAGASVTFTNLSAPAADGGTKTLTVRASFLATVTDGQQIQFTVASAGADPAGSTFAGNGGGAASSVIGTDGRIEVTATKLVFTSTPASVGVGANFTAMVQAQDANNNLDTDNAASVTITKASGSGILSGGGAQTLVNGAYSFTTLQISAGGTFTLAASDSPDNLTDATSGAITAALNLAVLQAASNSGNNTTAAILELDPALTAQTTSISTNPISGTGTNAIRISGSATSTGYLTRSDDGSILAFTGANDVNSGVNANTLTNRAVVGVFANGISAVQTTYLGTSGNQTRGATTLNNALWYVGEQSGIYTNGSVLLNTGNTRSVKAFGGMVYAFRASTTTQTVSTVSADGTVVNNLPGLPIGNANFTDFYLISSGNNGSAYDELYLMESSSTTLGLISKYSLVAGTWVANGSNTTAVGGFGLCAAKNGSGADLYLTSGQGASSANTVRKITDTAGYNASISVSTTSTVYTTASGTTLKGIDFMPAAIPEPAVQATTVSFANVLGLQMDVSWTAGDGAGYLVVCRQGGAPTSPPVDGTLYTADANFSGSGSALGGGKVVYAGSGTSFTLTGLSGSTSYTLEVYAYNGPGASANFLTSTGTGNPASQTTAAPNSTSSDIVRTGGFSEPVNVAYASYQTNDITGASDSIELARFTIEDGGGLPDADTEPTTLQSLTLNVGNASPLRRLALYDGATELAETDATATVTFSGLSVSAADDSTKALSLRATFQSNVVDNTQVSFTITAATADGAGSSFAAGNAGGAASDTTGDANRIEVTADRLLLANVYSGQFINESFSGNVRAVDGNGNVDLDNADSVTILKDGAGTLTGGAAQSLAAGSNYWAALSIDTAGSYTLTASNNTQVAMTVGTTPVTVQTPTLFAGAIAIIGMNEDNNDSFVFVAMTNLAAGTVITFTDVAWMNDGFTNSEGYVQWTATAPVAAGTAVTIMAQDANWNAATASTGTADPLGSSIGFSTSGDQILAFQGAWPNRPTTGTNVRWLYAMSSTGFINTGATTSNSSYLPTALGSFKTAFSSDLDNEYYANGLTSQTSVTQAHTVSDFLTLFADGDNLYYRNDVGPLAFPTYAFTILAEPPTAGATGIAFSGVANNALTVNFTSGNGANRIVIARQGSAVSYSPNDGTALTANGDFSAAAALDVDSNKVVYSGSGASAPVTGLDPATLYYFAIFEFNGSGVTVNYYQGGELDGSQNTLSLYDNDSTVTAPGTQVTAANVSSLATNVGSATDAFAFRITDTAATDATDTRVTQITLQPAGANTASWSSTIAGVTVYNVTDASAVTIGTPTISDASIVIPITAGNLDIPNGTFKDVRVAVYLKGSGLADNSVIAFQVPATGHGFGAAPTSSSAFATTFGGAVTGNALTVRVTATKLAFSSVPTGVGVGANFNATVQAQDANGNLDLDNAASVAITKASGSGTLTGGGAQSLVSGAYSFATLKIDSAGTFTLLASDSPDNLTDATSGSMTATPDLAVLQAAASANNTTAAILELDPSTVNQAAPVATTAISGTGTNAIRISGSATSTGYLTRSDDHSLLAFTGAFSSDTTSNANAILPRAVVAQYANGVSAIQTTYTGTGGNQTRGASSLNNATWYIGDQGGLYVNGTNAPSPAGNLRAIKSFGGTVYAFTSSATTAAVAVATAPYGGALNALPGLPLGNTQLQDFYLVASGSNGSTYDVLYVLQAASGTAGLVYKYSLVAGTWTANGTNGTPFGGFGLCAAKSGSGADLYLTTGTGASTANKIQKLTDTAGYNAAIAISTTSTLYTAAAGTILKGIDFVPTAVTEPTVQATAVTFANVFATQLDVAWTAGDGASHLVVCRQGGAPTSPPVDGTIYTANANFSGGGSALGGGKVVYAGASTNFTLTGLSGSTSYTLEVYEYNGSGATANFLTPAAAGNPANQTTITPNSTASDIVRAGGFSEPVNVNYAAYQTNDITGASDSIELARFTLRDGGASADADALPTTLQSLTLSVTNSANLRRLALYDGATELSEVAAGSLVTFGSLTATAADDGTLDLSLRATFQASVTDNAQVGFTVTNATASGTGSTFATANASGAASSLAGDANRIEVTATQLVLSTVPNAVSVGGAFTVPVQAQDADGNVDLDDTTAVTITQTSGSGTLSGGDAQNLVAGAKSFSALIYDTAGVFTLQATGGSLTPATSGMITAIGHPLVISGYMANPAGSDSAYEYVQVTAVENVDFSVTPVCVVWANNGTATANGWVQGGTLTYKFNITSGTMAAGDVGYIGGVSKLINGTNSTSISSLTWLRGIDNANVDGDGFGTHGGTSGNMGNGGANADGIAIFGGTNLTATSEPLDAVFYGTGIGTAFVTTTNGYTVPSNDHYTSGYLQSGSFFFTPDPASGAYTKLTGTYNTSTRTWDVVRTATAIPSPTLVSQLTTGVALAGTLTAPTALAATGLHADGFTANWTSVGGATGYRLDVSTSATFTTSGFLTGSNAYHNGMLGAGTPAGWTETLLNQGADYLRLTNTASALITPAMDFNASRSESLTFNARTYNGTNGLGSEVITVSISTDNGGSWNVLGTRTPTSSTMAAVTPFDVSGFSGTQVKIMLQCLGANDHSGAGVDEVMVGAQVPAAIATYVPGYNSLLVSGGGTTSKAVGGLDSLTTYYYRVRATDGLSQTADSNTIPATTTRATTIFMFK